MRVETQSKFLSAGFMLESISYVYSITLNLEEIPNIKVCLESESPITGIIAALKRANERVAKSCEQKKGGTE